MIKDFISNYPEVIAVLLGLFFTSLVGFVVWWMQVLRARVLDHITKDESRVWPTFEKKIDDLSEQMHQNHVSYIGMFGNMNTRMKLLESKFPNGGMKDILNSIELLTNEVRSLKKSL